MLSLFSFFSPLYLSFFLTFSSSLLLPAPPSVPTFSSSFLLFSVHLLSFLLVAPPSVLSFSSYLHFYINISVSISTFTSLLLLISPFPSLQHPFLSYLYLSFSFICTFRLFLLLALVSPFLFPNFLSFLLLIYPSLFSPLLVLSSAHFSLFPSFLLFLLPIFPSPIARPSRSLHTFCAVLRCLWPSRYTVL